MAYIPDSKYETEKPVIRETLEHLSLVEEYDEVRFVESLGRLPDRYYSAQLGDNSRFCATMGSTATYFNYRQYEKGNSPAQVFDPVRRLSGLYWTQQEVQNQENVNAATSMHVVHFRSTVDDEYIPLSVTFTNMFKSAEGSLESEEWVLLRVADNYLGTELGDLSFIENLNASTVYEDFTYSAPRFHEQSNFELKLEGTATNIVDIHGDYNYFNRDYETLSSSASVHEATLPNMYVFFAYQEQARENKNPAYEALLTLNGGMNISNHQDMFTVSRPPSQSKISPTEKYFSNWVNAYANSLSNGAKEELTSKFKNIHLSASDVKSIQSYGGRKELFPMWMNVEFTTDKIVEFAETLKETQIMGLLQNSIMEAVRTGSLRVDSMFNAFTEKNSVSDPSSSENIPTRQYHEQSVDTPYFDMSQWVEEFSNNLAASSSFESLYATFLGTLDESMRITDDPKYDFFKSLMAIILKGKMRKLLRKHSRTIQEVFSGKQCYNETLMYRIEKYDGQAIGAPLQTFYVPNSQDMDKFQYIDTQVKYNKVYTYVIYAYQIVVGNKYSYVDSVYRREDGGWSAVTVKNEPSLRLYETEMYTHTNKVLDNPPVSPEVEFIPYKGVNDKIKVIMNSGVGRYTLPYEIIEFEEQAQVHDIQRAQNRKHTDIELRYETDDYPAFYEIRRTTTKPKSYREFAGKLIQQISTSRSDLIASGVGFDDKIKPNNKYYYCIRSVDNHGHVSYPSPIYEVEMVDDKGSVYPVVRVCEFEKERKSQSQIGAKRYIRIKPSMPQTILNEEASGIVDANSVKDINDITLGIADESVWDKKFKIRLVSKSTGRKIDFNIKFKHEHDKLQEDI